MTARRQTDRNIMLDPIGGRPRRRSGNGAPDPHAGPRGSIQRKPVAEGVFVLTFDRPGSSANIFDRRTLVELDRQLDAIEAADAPRGLILVSAKPSIFIAGADLREFAGLLEGQDMDASLEKLRSLIELGQRVFTHLASLSLPTVAAIHGACVGGGLEMSLACDYRLASPERETRLGLPETRLGILPAWGGSTRLPRVIGLRRALPLILSGKTISARRARVLGILDELAPRERLVARGIEIILKPANRPPRPSWWRRGWLHHPLGALLLRRAAQRRSDWPDADHYPAVAKALKVVTQGISLPVRKSLQRECAAVLELAQTPSCHNLMRMFFLQERAKKLHWTVGSSDSGRGVATDSIRRAAVIGAGVMGAGIAQWLTAHGVQVILQDIDDNQVARGLALVDGLYRSGVDRHRFTALEARRGLDRLSTTTADVPLRHADLVIEAAVEDMEIKKRIFGRLAERAGPQTILASNTSALSITQLAEAAALPERVIGIHFFNPVHRMQLVELVISPHTSDWVVERSLRWIRRIGKLPVVVKDQPGFLVNRVLTPYLAEAVRLFEAGGSVEDIDNAMRAFGMPMGPLRLIDEVGTDIAFHVAKTLAARAGGGFTIPKTLEEMVAAGYLGRKSGRGFYRHAGRLATVNASLAPMRSESWARPLRGGELQRRMVLRLVNEAARCLEKGVVSEPEDVDFGMVMGTGFAPFRGGPLRYADAMGIGNLTAEMMTLFEQGCRQFQPCNLLRDMTARRSRFYPR